MTSSTGILQPNPVIKNLRLQQQPRQSSLRHDKMEHNMSPSTSSSPKSKAETEKKGRQNTKRGKEVGIGRRGAAVALAKTGLPVRDIAKLIQVPSSTVSGIVQHAEEMAKINGGDSLDDINLKPKKRSGRPKKWRAEDRLVIVELCTRDEIQRSKPYSTLAKECPFPIDEHAIRKILSEAGYDRQRDIPDETPASPSSSSMQMNS